MSPKEMTTNFSLYCGEPWEPWMPTHPFWRNLLWRYVDGLMAWLMPKLLTFVTNKKRSTTHCWGLYRDKQVGNSGCGGTTITWVTWHRMNATSWRRNSYLLWSSKYVRRLVSIFSIMSTGKRELCSRCTLKNWTTRGWDCLGPVQHSASKLPMNFVYYSWWIVFEQNVMQTLGSTHCPISFYHVHGTICSFSNFTPVNTRFWDEEAGKLGALRGWAYALCHIYRKVTWC